MATRSAFGFSSDFEQSDQICNGLLINSTKIGSLESMVPNLQNTRRRVKGLCAFYLPFDRVANLQECGDMWD